MFKTKNDFSLYIEKLKIDNEFQTFIEALLHYYEHESDAEMDEIVKMLNQKILDRIQLEAEDRNLIKGSELVRLLV